MMEATKDWPSILQFETGATVTEAEVEKHYRRVAKKAHPDAGGSNEAMTQVNLAKGLALAWVAKERARIAAPQIERQQIFQQQHVNAYGQQNAYQQQAYASQQQAAGWATAQQAWTPAYIPYEPVEQPNPWWKRIFK